MIERIIRFSVERKLIILIFLVGLIGAGVYSLQNLPIDAVPDITNNQVQVVTSSPSLAPQEVEQFITYPVEVAMANIPNVVEIRSISRFGLSVVTIVFEDRVPMLEARQFVKEQIDVARAEIPEGLGTPEMMPITTGLGEIYQYVLQVKPGYEQQFDAMRLRTIQDWIVKRQLAGTAGIIEISSFGGYLKQYEIALDPILLQSADVTISEVFTALSKNNQNSGGSYIEKRTNAYYIRTEGTVKQNEDIENIVVANHNGTPIYIKDVGKVHLGSAKRFGAMTMDGQGETVGGITLMLKGANSSEAIANVHDRIEEVKKSLPEGVEIYPYLDRSVLVGKAIHTVQKNLIEGGLIVIVVLILLLGDLRAGLIVASVIPLAMLFAIILMNYFGVSANLMSLGAIDFGIVVDGAVIVVEGVLHALVTYHVGKRLSQEQMNDIVVDASAKLFRSAVFGVFIILVVFVPIMTLTGIEGKMFRPMALTFSFAILGALLLSLTYVPMVASAVLPKKVRSPDTFADKIMNFLRRLYKPTLEFFLRWPALAIGPSLAVLIGAFFLFRTLGAEFIPTLEEGDLAMQMTIQPGSALTESIKTSTRAEKILLDNFPEVRHVVSKIGTAEVPTDPMAIEDADIMIILREKEEWTSAHTREDLVEKMKEKLSIVPGASFEFTQPIQLRFNELMTGAKTDIAVKIFGENTETLKELADHAAGLIKKIPGAGDVKVEQTDGLPQLVVEFNRRKIAEYGLNIEDLNTLVRTAFAGETAGVVFENERKFDLVVRLAEQYRQELNLNHLFIHLPNNISIPLSEVASTRYIEGPMQISREDARRRINIGVNVRNRDVASLVADIQQSLDRDLPLPAGYSVRYGGQFENLEKAQKRLSVAIPVVLVLIFFLLYFTFEKIKYALMIFTAVPLSAIGGVVALWIRGMPFSISAGVGFIALFGVAVLNGIVLISYFNALRYDEGMKDVKEVVIKGALVRLRPVIMTATVAALGFLPMATSTSNGAEVQKPLATVVIGGLITATLLTMVFMPVLYYLTNRRIDRRKAIHSAMIALAITFTGTLSQAQAPVDMQEAIQHALSNHPQLQNAELNRQKAQLGMEEAREIPPAQFNLQAGQTNTSLIDYNFSASQSLGNPLANRRRKAIAEADIALRERQIQLLKHQVAAQVRQTWYEWRYWRERVVLLERQQELYQNLAAKAAIQRTAGETSQLEQTVAENQLLSAQRLLANASLEEDRAWNDVLQAAWLTEGEPPEQPLEPLTLTLPDTSGRGDLFTAPFRQRVTIAQRTTALQEALTRPEFSLGYFNQSIRPDFNLQGLTANVAIPLWRQAQKARIEKARLDEQIAANQLTQQQSEWQRERNLARRQVDQLQRQLSNQGRDLRQQAERIRQLTEAQFTQGEVDYFRYAQSLSAALQNELDYLDLIRQYNQAVLQLSFLTPN